MGPCRSGGLQLAATKAVMNLEEKVGQMSAPESPCFV
jgi:hypothetical protein